jgi:hypothetical protein
MLRLLYLLAVALLTGCATDPMEMAKYLPADAPSYTRAPAPPKGHALLYIYRVGAYPRLRMPDVLVGGNRVWEPPELGYTWIHIP